MPERPYSFFDYLNDIKRLRELSDTLADLDMAILPLPEDHRLWDAALSEIGIIYARMTTMETHPLLRPPALANDDL